MACTPGYISSGSTSRAPCATQGTLPMSRGSLDGREVWGRTDTCMRTAESLRCSSETTAMFLIGYTLIQNKSLKFERAQTLK